MDEEKLQLSITEIQMSNPKMLAIFTSSPEGEIKIHLHDTGKKDSSLNIPPEEKRFAEAHFLDYYNEKGEKQKMLRVDLLGGEEIFEKISRVISFYNQALTEKRRQEITVMINLMTEGAFMVPFNKLINPSDSLRACLKNLPEIIRRRSIKYYLLRAIENAKRKEEFLSYLYGKEDDKAKELIRSSLYDNKFKDDEYLNRVLERMYGRFISLRNRFNFDLTILNLKEEELREKIKEIPAVPNDLFIPLIYDSPAAEKKEVSLSRIITAQAKETNTQGKNWLDYLIDRGKDYMRKFIRACLRGDINLKNPNFDNGYNLLHLGNGFFMVLNGRHRTAAAKLLGATTIEAHVYDLLPKRGEKREIFPQYLEIIKDRINQGLIKGQILHEGEKAFLIVEDYEDPSVFYEDMFGVRMFFYSSK